MMKFFQSVLRLVVAARRAQTTLVVQRSIIHASERHPGEAETCQHLRCVRAGSRFAALEASICLVEADGNFSTEHIKSILAEED